MKRNRKKWRADRAPKLQLSSRLSQKLKEQEDRSAAEREAQETAQAETGTRWLHPVRIGVTLLLFVALSVAVWILPLRPKHSEFEQRTLAAFPSFSWQTLTDGRYFDDISLWFSDTFPGRETWVNLSAAINRCCGLRTETIHGNIQQGDAIPVVPTTTTTTTTTTATTTTTTTTTVSSQTSTTTKPSSTGQSSTTAQKTTTTKKTTADKDIQNQNQNLGGLLVRGDTAYEYYNFVRSIADDYIAIVNRAGKKWSSTASVYSLLAPTSIDIMLPDNKKPSATSDQGAAIAYFYGNMTGVKTVDARTALLSHNKEYLYFHTDHHWTARGAYYAYAEFMKAQGKQPTPLSEYKEHAYDGFLGSFYATTKDANLKLGADTVYAYEPLGNIDMFYRAETNGSNIPYKVISDMTSWSPRYKYNTFIAGDQPYVEITNADVKDKSSIVLIKESFGNAFAPFLVTQYHKVYVIDYRYYTGNLTNFIKKNKVGTVLFLNNMSATRNSYLVGALDDLVG